MYEGDAPLAERRAAALALDRDLLRELLGAEELRELLDPGVLADVELELQCLTDGRRARSADELHDVLRRVGDLSAPEIDLRSDGDGAAMLDELVEQRRAIELGLAGEVRFEATESPMAIPTLARRNPRFAAYFRQLYASRLPFAVTVLCGQRGIRADPGGRFAARRVTRA